MKYNVDGLNKLVEFAEMRSEFNRIVDAGGCETFAIAVDSLFNPTSKNRSAYSSRIFGVKDMIDFSSLEWQLGSRYNTCGDLACEIDVINKNSLRTSSKVLQNYLRFARYYGVKTEKFFPTYNSLRTGEIGPQARATGLGQHVTKFKDCFSKDKDKLRKMIFDRSIDVLSEPSRDGIEDFFGEDFADETSCVYLRNY